MPAPSSDVRHLIERIADAFEEAWLAGSKPRIESYLKDVGDARREVLVELAFTDLEYRLRAGETKIVEDLGQRFPELKVDPDLWGGLIVEEHHQRQRLGEKPTKDEYEQRFPDQASRLDTVFGRDERQPPGVPTRAYSLGGKLPTLGSRYRAQRIVAEGGMGYVARVVDTEFDRPLAMKVLAEKLKGNKELEERFLREARLTGQLQHPGIPPVQEKGRLDDGTPYFIMKLIKGHSLQKLLRDRPSPQDRLGYFVGIFESMSQTLAYAHSRGIIHRDLKPANIMVGSFGEVQVMDWGLAKVLRPGSKTGEHPTSEDYSSTVHIVQSPTSVGQHTLAGSIMGTPGYMAPEQARGEVDALDQRCDVFGLGSILCDILTGLPPFAPTAGLSSQRQAMTGDLSGAFARLDRSGADADLIALAKRCLAPEAKDRPADAKAVADAVTAYQTQVEERLKQAELEQARLVTKAQEDKKRRRDRRIAGVCIVGLLLVGFLAWQWYQRKFAEAERQMAFNQVVRQVDEAFTVVSYCDEMIKRGLLDDARRALQKVAEDAAIADKAKASLTSADAAIVGERLDEFRKRLKNATFALNLEYAFEGRGQLKESDFDMRTKATVVFGKSGPKMYEKAFADFGASLPNGDLGTATKRLEDFPIRDALGLGLIDWMLFERTRPSAQRLNEFADALDRDPLRARLRKGILARDADDLAQLSKELDVTSQPPRFAILLADALNGLQRPDDALALLSRAHDDIPGDFWINELLGVFIRVLAPERNAEAVARFESAYVLRPRAPFVTTNLARSFIVARRYDLAQKVCERYLKQIDANEPQVRTTLADALLWQGKIPEAEEVLRVGLAAQPNSGFLRAARANILSYQGNHQDAGTLAKGVLDDFPGFFNAVSPLGYAYLNTGEPKLALETGEYLIVWNPNAAIGYDLAAQALVQLRDIRKAEQYAVKGVAAEPKSPNPHNTLGYVLLAKGDHTGAFRSYQKASELTPGPMPHLKMPAAELARLPDHNGEAAWLYAEVVKRDPKDQPAWDGLIGVLKVTRDVAETKDHLGPTLAKLSPAQIKSLDAIPPPDRQVNSNATISRPINSQQNAAQQGSTKRNRN